MSGHGEYPSDNYEFHTHVEGLGGGGPGHSHGAAGAVVKTTGHGVGRFRRALEALGYEVRDIIVAIDGAIAPDCRVVIDAGPRTPYTDIESAALAAYFSAGGAALLLYDLGFEPAPAHAALLRRLGIALRDAVVVDPDRHYASDPEMVAVTAYGSHPVTRRMSFTFYPGARPLALLNPAGGVTVAPLFSSSTSSYSQSLPGSGHRHAEAVLHSPAAPSLPQPYVLAAASSGKLDAGAARSFRAIVVGDSDFASNSFYPYMSNNRLALAMVRWLAGEEGSVPVAARIPVRQTVVLTNRQQRRLFMLLVVALPLLTAGVGAWVWLRRR
jgi:gliding motility-associatede transport system auxiliary component